MAQVEAKFTPDFTKTTCSKKSDKEDECKMDSVSMGCKWEARKRIYDFLRQDPELPATCLRIAFHDGTHATAYLEFRFCK